RGLGNRFGLRFWLWFWFRCRLGFRPRLLHFRPRRRRRRHPLLLRPRLGLWLGFRRRWRFWFRLWFRLWLGFGLWFWLWLGCRLGLWFQLRLRRRLHRAGPFRDGRHRQPGPRRLRLQRWLLVRQRDDFDDAPLLQPRPGDQHGLPLGPQQDQERVEDHRKDEEPVQGRFFFALVCEQRLLTCLPGGGLPQPDAAPQAAGAGCPRGFARPSLLGLDTEGNAEAAALAGCVHGPHHMVIGGPAVGRHDDQGVRAPRHGLLHPRPHLLHGRRLSVDEHGPLLGHGNAQFRLLVHGTRGGPGQIDADAGWIRPKGGEQDEEHHEEEHHVDHGDDLDAGLAPETTLNGHVTHLAGWPRLPSARRCGGSCPPPAGR